MGNIGVWGVVILALVVLLVFGPKRLPQIGRSLGLGMREFKETVTDQTKELKEATLDAPKQFKDGLNPFKETDEPAGEQPPATVGAEPAPTDASQQKPE